MSSPATARIDSSTANRRGLAVLFVLLLNLAITPCAMAFGSEHVCPHSAPEIEQPGDGHHGHSEPGQHCDSTQADCCTHATASVTANSEVKLHWPWGGAAAVAPAIADVVTPTTTLVFAVPEPPDPPRSPVPLFVLNCVYLK